MTARQVVVSLEQCQWNDEGAFRGGLLDILKLGHSSSRKSDMHSLLETKMRWKPRD